MIWKSDMWKKWFNSQTKALTVPRLIDDRTTAYIHNVLAVGVQMGREGFELIEVRTESNTVTDLCYKADFRRPLNKKEHVKRHWNGLLYKLSFKL